jgi:BCD family chlorophyll transporter-like MFS transporter
MSARGLGWAGIVRLGLAQTALGGVVVLTTSTLNRVMVVELALPAMLPGFLVALHYAVQILRPRLGYGSDLGGRRTPWIIGGMAVLCCGGVLAAAATALMATQFAFGVALAACAFPLVGVGVGAAGTSLLVLLAKRVDPGRRAAAAGIVWVMMICGFIATAGLAGHFLDPYTPDRLVSVSATVSACAFVLALVAVHGVEGGAAAGDGAAATRDAGARPAFRAALRQVWQEPQARRFTVFVFLSMLAYSAQDLILEPFAGSVFGFTPGASTQLAAVQHGGVLAGMLGVALVATLVGRVRTLGMRFWTIGGCVASAAALLSLSLAAFVGPGWPLRGSVFALGAANGVFAISAIASMMELAGRGRESREGVRMGLWGAAQAIAFGLGGFLGTAASDLARWLVGEPAAAYALVFGAEAALFLVAIAYVTEAGSPRSALRAATGLAAEGGAK